MWTSNLKLLFQKTTKVWPGRFRLGHGPQHQGTLVTTGKDLDTSIFRKNLACGCCSLANMWAMHPKLTDEGNAGGRWSDPTDWAGWGLHKAGLLQRWLWVVPSLHWPAKRTGHMGSQDRQWLWLPEGHWWVIRFPSAPFHLAPPSYPFQLRNPYSEENRKKASIYFSK